MIPEALARFHNPTPSRPQHSPHTSWLKTNLWSSAADDGSTLDTGDAISPAKVVSINSLVQISDSCCVVSTVSTLTLIHDSNDGIINLCSLS